MNQPAPPTRYPLAPKPPLAADVLFLDGISRSGKKLTCCLVSRFAGIEYFNYMPLIERTCHVQGLGQSDLETTAYVIQTMVDEATYARIIGRNLNTRVSDETSIYKAPDVQIYFDRATAPDGDAAIAAFLATGRTAFYHTHSVLPFAETMFLAFPAGRFIHVTRNPVDIAEDWLRRGWGERWGSDPRAFGVNTPHGDHVVPWFAAAWAADYIRMSPAERCVHSILDLQARERQALATLPAAQRRRIFQVCLESLLAAPDQTVSALGQFLGRPPPDDLAAFFAAERLPNTGFAAERAEKIKILSRNAGADTMSALSAADDAYEELSAMNLSSMKDGTPS